MALGRFTRCLILFLNRFQRFDIRARLRKRILSRDKLLDAATRLFHENGYQAVTVNDICEAAQLTKGAFLSSF